MKAENLIFKNYLNIIFALPNLGSFYMANHEDEKQFILNHLGTDAKRILEGAGINVEGAIEQVLEEKEWQFEVTRRKQLIELKNLPIPDILTSELVQLCALPGDNSEYSQELQRRLFLLELTDKQKEMFIALDLEALGKKDPQFRQEALAVGYHILDSTTIETLPDPSSCLTSELIMVADDANAALARDHDWLSDKAFAAVCFVRGEFHFDKEKPGWVWDKKGPYIEEYERRFDLIGLEEWQRSSFIRNECLITARAKWDYRPGQKSWTKESIIGKEQTNLGQI